MHAIVIGFVHRKGIAKASGRPYDMRQILVLSPVKPGAGENWQLDGYGYQPAEIDVLPEADVSAFANIKFPATAELILGSDLRGGKLVSVVESFKSVKSIMPASVVSAAA